MPTGSFPHSSSAGNASCPGHRAASAGANWNCFAHPRALAGLGGYGWTIPEGLLPTCSWKSHGKSLVWLPWLQGSSGEIHPLSPSPNPKCGQGPLWESVELPALPSLLGRVSELEEFLVPKNFSSYNTKSWMVLGEAWDRGALRHRDSSGVQEYPSQQCFRAGFGAAASQQPQGDLGFGDAEEIPSGDRKGAGPSWMPK